MCIYVPVGETTYDRPDLVCRWGFLNRIMLWNKYLHAYLTLIISGFLSKSLINYWKILEGPSLLCDQWSDQCPLGPVLLVWSGHITPLPRSIFPRIRGGWVGWGLSWCQPKFSARGWRTHVLPSDWFRHHMSKHLRNNFCKGSRQTRSEEKVGLLDQSGWGLTWVQLFSRKNIDFDSLNPK